METVQRPLWRAFPPRALAAAARHARAGGLSVIKERSWRMLGAAAPDGSVTPVIEWAIKALDPSPYYLVRSGPALGCVWARVAAEDRPAVQAWIDRDRGLPGATVGFSFDCQRCGACCFGAEVVVEKEDLRRFRELGRAELSRRTRKVPAAPWRLLPIVKETQACVYLQEDLRCSIYVARPGMCREFLAGSEHCMVSREEKYGESILSDR